MFDRACSLVVLLCACGTGSGQLVFTERAAEAGCVHVHQTVAVAWDLEFMAAGGAAGDFDRDGSLDLFVLGGSGGFDRLFLNDGRGNFTDVSVAAGVSRKHRGTGVAVGDYNADGWLDIFVTSIGSATAEGPGFNLLYRNNGNGTFTDVTAFTMPLDMNTVRGFAPRFVDMNGDRRPELLWVGDFFTSRYLVNNGNGTFSNFTAGSGTGLDSNGMGNTFGDFDNDGRLDWYVTSRINREQSAGSGNMLYRQTATAHVFEEISVAAGVNFGLWGWGADAQDFDHDGWLDIVTTNGYTPPFQNDATMLFMNNGDGSFAERGAWHGITDAGQGRGLLTGDFTGNGARDVVIFNNRQPMLYYRNDLPDAGSTSITLFFDTRFAPTLPPDGFGTQVTLATPGLSQRRQIDGGSNYLAQSELSAHFGLGGAERGEITVRYADGVVDVFPDVPAGRYRIERLVCAADFRQDGQLNFFDVSDFLDRYNQRHPMGDFNRDGRFNFFDVAGFVAAYNAGCP